ncbi:MAG: PD-(D/E)XK nuclease family protein [Zavarzinella sp.]
MTGSANKCRYIHTSPSDHAAIQYVVEWIRFPLTIVVADHVAKNRIFQQIAENVPHFRLPTVITAWELAPEHCEQFLIFWYIGKLPAGPWPVAKFEKLLIIDSLAVRERDEHDQQILQELQSTDIEGNLAPPARFRALADAFLNPPPQSIPIPEGLHFLEAQAIHGELRMICRKIHEIHRQGEQLSEIALAVPHLSQHDDIVHQMFVEYAIPFQHHQPISTQSSVFVRFLRKVLQVAERGWRVRDIASLLQNRYIFTHQTEKKEVAQKLLKVLELLNIRRLTPAFLNLLGEVQPLDKDLQEDHVLKDLDKLRAMGVVLKIQEFARELLHSLNFSDLRCNVASFRQLIEQALELFELSETAFSNETDQLAYRTLMTRLHSLAEFPHDQEGWDLSQWLNWINQTFEKSFDCLISPTKSVQVIDLKHASGIRCKYMFLLHLNEGMVGQNDTSDRLRLNFATLITIPSEALYLCRSIANLKGQEVNPASVYEEVVDLFPSEQFSQLVERQKMLIENFGYEISYAHSEWRISIARAFQQGPDSAIRTTTGGEFYRLLQRWLHVRQARFYEKRFTNYDGIMQHPGALQQAATSFPVDRKMSPTSLEVYQECGFRFLLQDFIKLKQFQEPRSEIENTRRGMVMHRALANFHEKFPQPPETEAQLKEFQTAFEEQIQLAVDDFVKRAPTKALSKLWQLEGQRLVRTSQEYILLWQQYAAPWREAGYQSTVKFLEQEFGKAQPVTVEVDGIQVQITGRIDRIDLLEKDEERHIWVFDYKIGAGTEYTLSAVESLQKMQLPIYAIGASDTLSAESPVQVVGMSYWMVAAKGLRTIYPAKAKNVDTSLSWRSDPRSWQEVRRNVTERIAEIAIGIRTGYFPLAPKSHDCTRYCPYREVCRIGPSRRLIPLRLQQSSPTISDEELDDGAE